MSEPETLDIIAEMRRFAKRHWMHDEGQNMRMFADRLEVTYKRELGNAQKMREALKACLFYLERIDHGMNDYMRGLFETAYKKTEDALAT